MKSQIKKTLVKVAIRDQLKTNASLVDLCIVESRVHTFFSIPFFPLVFGMEFLASHTHVGCEA